MRKMIYYTDGLFGDEGRQKSDNISAISELAFIHEKGKDHVSLIYHCHSTA